MAISQPTYPVTTSALVSHIGAYADSLAGGGGAVSLDYINVQRDYASDVAAAYAAAPAGATLYCPKGTYNVWTSAVLTLGSKAVRFVGDGNGATVWQGPSSRDGVNITGSLSASSALTADAPRSPGSGTGYLPKLTLTAGGIASLGLAAGDYVLVKSNKTWTGTLQSNTHGELARIFAVDSPNNQIQLQSMLSTSYAVADGAAVQKVNFAARTVIEGIDFQNTTPQAGGGAGAGTFVAFSYAGPGTRISDGEMRDCDSRGVLMWYALGTRVARMHFKDFKGNPAQSYNAYGVSLFQASQGNVVESCTADNIWEMVTTNGSANPGIPRWNTVRDCECRNPFSAGFGMHEEGQYNVYRDLSVIGGHEKATGTVVARGMSVRHPDAIVQNISITGSLQYAFWVREDTGSGGGLTAGRGLRARGIHIRDHHYYTLGGSIGALINGDDCVIEDLSIDGVDDYPLQVGGSRNHIEVDAQRAGMQGGDVAGNWPIGRFSAGASDNHVVVKRARNGSTGAVWGADNAPSGMARNRVVVLDVDQNIPIGNKAWMRGCDPVQFSKAGAQIAVTSVGGRIYIQQPRRIRGVWVSLGTAPTGATFIVDVNKNGTTIFTTQANRPTVAISGFASAIAFPDVDTLVAGDYLSVDVDQIGSTVAGSDLQVIVDFAA